MIDPRRNEIQSAAGVLGGGTEARSLLAELAQLKATLAGNEIQRRVPQSRQRYWSRIERAITRKGAAARHFE